MGENVQRPDFSRCLPVMAPAMIGIGSGSVDGGVSWRSPTNAVTTEVVTTNSSPRSTSRLQSLLACHGTCHDRHWEWQRR
ncbi:hypothetical protein NG799_00955, partial [Laspinema sp. D1]|nr:hypothetical protein [Laspinema sp. D2a]